MFTLTLSKQYIVRLIEMENNFNNVFNSECGAHSVSLALWLKEGGNNKHDYAHNSLPRKDKLN